VCAKTLSPAAEVAVVSESDKIAKPGAMSEHVIEDNDTAEVRRCWDASLHPVSSKFTVRNVYFEWVPSEWIDVYVCENSVTGKDDIQRISKETEEMEAKIYGHPLSEG